MSIINVTGQSIHQGEQKNFDIITYIQTKSN